MSRDSQAKIACAARSISCLPNSLVVLFCFQVSSVCPS